MRKVELENTFLGFAKAKAEEQGTQLKLELEQSQVSFVKEKKDLKVAYQKQVDDMLFYDYNYYMRKHKIMDDIHSILFVDEEEPGKETLAVDGRDVNDKSTKV